MMSGIKAARLQDIGCMACRKDGRFGVPSDQHHPLKGYRMGASIVVPLCVWHHRGVCVGNPEAYAERWGPSLAHHGKRFRERYGTDAEMLAAFEGLLKLKEQA